MRKTKNGFALVEVVIVIVLISGSMLVFLEAISQAKSYQIKSEINTVQAIILNSKVNEIRSRGFDYVPLTNNFLTILDYPNYSYSLQVNFVDENLNISTNQTNLKMIKIIIRHNSNNYNEISDTFLVSNAL
tara:strand:+ start:217 stop:609 length:393 start_codon:yes stop_codon:yes gene_type:complete